MAMQAPAAALPPALSQLRHQREPLRLALLWLIGACGALVFLEPGPYEFVFLVALVVFAITGLSFPSAIGPLVLLLTLVNIGYSLSANALFGDQGVLTWVITSWYLAATAIFFAAVIGTNTEARLNALLLGCLMAGVVAALAGTAGYFRLIPGAGDWFLLYDRARGTFKDPNVFGAFLVLPSVIALQRVIAGGLWQSLRNLALLALFTAAILLSFSRGAWGQMVLAGLMLLLLTFVTTPSPHRRMRIVLLAGAGLAATMLFVAALTSIDMVEDLLKQRLSLGQSYDVGETGRFGRHLLGSLLALDVPLGIGPLQFSKVFPEDPHNTYLNAFMAGGWLSGLAFLTLAALTLVFGLGPVLTPTPWQPAAIVVYSAYVGVMAESVIIDTDHWRHAFLLLGLQWGLIAAARAYVRERRLRHADGMPGARNPALARQQAAK
jgi:O-antigen ligase